ncbi:MAG: sulfurtransferase TusA family protein, partial [bacterium]|nr:sulfurtransferase TusA family protein [bacterium]
MEKELKADSVLEVVGLFCPLPILLTTERMKELSPGMILEVVSDDPEIMEDMPSWCKITGNQFLQF